MARVNVQDLLLTMRKEQRDDHEKLVEKVDEGFKAIALVASNHELQDQKLFAALDKRVVIVENTRRSIRWLGATVLVTLLGGVADFLFVHLPKLLGGAK